MNKYLLAVAWFSAALPFSGVCAAGNEEYPFRARYPDVLIVTTDELKQRFNDVLIIDVRSKFEFDTLHVLGAINVPVDKTGFGEAMLKLRDKHKKPFVFYCNGKTCHKSYHAAALAAKARLNDLYAYDAGIFDWARAQPERTVLLGKSPIQPGDLIDEGQFKAHLLEAKDFGARVGPNTVVLDVRDRAQRDTALFPFREQRAELGELAKIDALIQEAKAHNKTLLVYDEVGKQVQWFQYHLESRGLRDYYFMKGGAQAYFDATLGKVVLGGGGKAGAAK